MKITEIVHFRQGDQGSKIPSKLELFKFKPTTEKGFPREGSILIKLKGKDKEKAFKLTPQEALKLSEELKITTKDLIKEKQGLWEERAKKYRKKQD